MSHSEDAPRAATVEIVEESQASPEVKAIFEDIKATKEIGFVPNFWKTLATHPPLLQETWTRLKAVMATGHLDPLTKEMIAVAVSATNGCRYCINSHTAAVKKLGLSDAALGELMAVVSLFNGTNALADGYQIEPDVRP